MPIPSIGTRIHFKVVITDTPTLIDDKCVKLGIHFINEGPKPIRVGKDKDMLNDLGMLVPVDGTVDDDLSCCPWYGVVVSGSESIVSGFKVI